MKESSIKQGKRQEVCKDKEGIRRVSLPSGEIIVNIKADFLEMGISCGFQVLETMLEEDVENLCGPRYKHQEGKTCFRLKEGQGER